MKVNLTLLCLVTRCNGSMKFEMFDQTTPIYVGENLPNGPMRVDCQINWPTTVNIITSNKNPDDMEVDVDGNTLKDKSIEVVGILINNFPIHQDLIDKLFICRAEGSSNTTHENWWGFNGKIKIEFDQPNPMRYMLALKNEFNMNRLHWDINE